MAAIPDQVKQLIALNYFHKNMDRHKAECMLLQNGKDGTFLIRNCSNSSKTEFAVSVMSGGAVRNFKLFWRDNQFYFGHGTYNTVEDLSYHFSNKPLLAGEDGQTVILNDAYPCIVNEPQIYDTVMVHAEDPTRDTLRRKDNDFSVNSKSGFLTKLGAVFKNWKNRWFVLQKNELKYFKNPSDRSPVRVLNLAECEECMMEENPYRGKDNVFRLVFPSRTFYMFSHNKEESENWVKKINWKLQNK